MLANPELFQMVEDELKKQGVIQRFEAEQGEIIGRMMITLGNVSLSQILCKPPK